MRRWVFAACCGLILGGARAASALPPPGMEQGSAPVSAHTLHTTGSQQILSIHQGPDGVVWAGGAAALHRFDGAHWTQHQHDPRIRFIWGVHAEQDRVLVLGENALGWFQRDAGGAYAYTSELARLPPLATGSEDFVDFRAVPEGYWIKSRQRMLFLPQAGPAAAWSGSAGMVLFEVHGQIWTQSVAHGLVRLRWLGGQIQAESVPGTQALRTVLIAGVLDLGTSGVVVVTRQGRLYRWQEGQLLPLQDAERDAALAERSVESTLVLREGRFALGFLRGGVWVLDADGQVAERHEGPHIGSSMVNRLFEDAEGGLWLAQDAGLRRIERGAGLSVFDDALGMPGARQLFRHQGQLLAASQSGIYRLRPSTPRSAARFELLTPRIHVVTDGLSTGRSVVLATGKLWRLRLPAQGEPEVVQLPVGPGTLRLVRASRFHRDRIYAGGDGFVLVIDEVESDQPRVQRIEGLLGKAEGLAEQDAEWIWASSAFQGPWAIRLDADGRELERVMLGSAQGRVAGERVHVQPGLQAPWFAGQHGIQQFDRTLGRLRNASLPAPAQQPNALVFRVIEDETRSIWMRSAGRFGVFWRTPQGYVWDEDVLGPLDTGSTVYDVLREAQIVWVARSDHVVRLDLTRRRPAPPVGTLVLSGVQDPRTGTRWSLTEPRLPAHQRDVAFSFGLPSYQRHGGVRYRTQLQGYDADWSEWGVVAQRSYTNLPDGDLRFAVEARDARGRWVVPLNVPLQVAAPWWRSRTAWAAYALALLILLWLTARLAAYRRQRSLLARQRALERTVEARTQELAHKNQQLETQAARLREVDALKSRFFSNVSHEFRTPLTLVLGPLDDVLGDPALRLQARVRELLELANRNAQRVLDLIVELLDVNRLEHGQLPLQRVVGDLGLCARRCAEAHVALFQRHGLAFELELPEAALVGSFDPVQIERCIANLLGNAAKYTGREGRVELRCMEIASGHARVEVRDTGRGVSAEALPQIFDRFYQQGDAPGGVGIGLALVRELVELHGGTVGVESRLGEGSCFWFDLPGFSAAQRAPVVDPVETRAIPTSLSEVEQTSANDPEAAPRERLRALVIDDHADLRLRLRGVLQSRYAVIEAVDGPSGLAQIRSELPDVVICDVMMPGFDGIELARRMRADPEVQSIPLLLLTARAGATYAVEGLTAGADDYLAKPFDALELLARVDALIAMRRRLQYQLQQGAPNGWSLPSGDSEEDRWRERMERCLHAGLADSGFSVDAWAAAMHTDRTTLFRRMKALLGMSPSEYLREVRLRQARSMLEAQAGSVTEVAYAVGFESLSSFARAFRGRYQCAPSEVGRVRAASA